MKAVSILALCVVGMSASAQTVHRSPEVPTFEGREVVVYEPALTDEPGIFPAGPAKVCIEGPPKELCYTAPEDFGWRPKVEAVPVSKENSALFFTASGGGVSGRLVYYALLVPKGGKYLENLLVGDTRFSDQGQVTFWSEPEVSEAKIFVTANVIWGPGEAHYGEHRYEIAAYIWLDSNYWQADKYVTSRWYDVDHAKADVLGSERAEILARLKKVLPGVRQRAQ